MSELHRTNLAKCGFEVILDSPVASSSSYSSAASAAYRDRAQERRKKFGVDKIETKSSLKVRPNWFSYKKYKHTATNWCNNWLIIIYALYRIYI